METINCVCGKCDGPYIDPEYDDYLETHFECDGCGSDFPIEGYGSDLPTSNLTVVELNRTVFHFCEGCNEE
jgi:hypothetical protein